MHADDIWNAPAFSASAEALRAVSATIKTDKDAETTLLLNHVQYTFDAQGRSTEVWHRIYRVENEEGVKDWAETSCTWEPWHESKPEIKARVITPDGAIHQLDPKTLNDVPAHEDEPDLYTDDREYGGPLPAIAVGAIVEEEIILKDTAPFFAGGQMIRYGLMKGVPVTRTQFIISRPENLPLHYVLQLLSDASVTKSNEGGIETITIEHGPFDAMSDDTGFLPSDVVPYPEVEFSTGSSWQQIALEYSHLVNDKLRAKDVKALLAHVNTKDGSRMEIIRRLVNTLHKSVRYTGVEFGESSLVPQFPSETLVRKYGDCKDKAALLVTMLRASGIPADLALLSTGPGQDVNTELPGMGLFDHAIVYVPASAHDPELWIDATAQYSQVGVLPEMDYGRRALIIDEKTAGLTKIPDLTSAQNEHRETRQFTLAEYGPATIVETNSNEGPKDAGYRDYYTDDSKKLREASEKYVKSVYLSDSLISLQKSDPSDLDKPFTVTFTAKGRRGFSDRENSTVYIYPEAVMSGLPEYFETKEEPQKDEAEKENSAPKKPRKYEWQLNPFTNEWHYKIIAPPGFKLRSVPPDKEQDLASAHYSQKFTSNADGSVVEAAMRFDSGKSRLTVEEGKKLRDAILRAEEADPIVVTFDEIGYALLTQGKIKESLAAYQQLAALHPREALHKTQLANAYLSAGLGDKARAMAKEATVLEPASADAFSQLGWIMEHDLIGRRLGKGFNYKAAAEAYRRARQLDPKETNPQDKYIQVNYAILLEFDPDGERYTEKSQLVQAIAELREVKKRDEETGKRYEDNILYDLWYLGKFKELEEEVATLPGTDVRRGLLLAAIAAQHGSDAALKKSMELTSSEEERGKSLANAAWLLLRGRKYPESAAIFAAATSSQGRSGQAAAFINALKNTKPYEDNKLPGSDPRSVVQAALGAILSPDVTYEKVTPFMSKIILENEPPDPKDDFRTSIVGIKKQAQESGMTVRALKDIVLSSARYMSEGDDALGYKITVETLGGKSQEVYIVREDGQYKILEFLTESKAPEEIGWEVLAKVEKNDLAGARKWLDWVREKVHITEGDDPLSGQPFPHFWTKGQEGDVNAIRTAALVLLPSKYLKGKDLSALAQIRDASKPDADRQRLSLVLASAYAAQERWTDLLPVSEELIKASPDSMIAFHLAEKAYIGSKHFDDLQKLIDQRIAKHPDELDYVRSEVMLARYRDDFAGAQKLIKPLIQNNKATDSDLNLFAWDSLAIPGPISPDAMEAAERANERTKSANFGILHTLACLYAQNGKASQSKELLLKAMDVGSLEEPDSAIWFGFGKLAEQYGETQVAQILYARVDKPKTDAPASTYALARQRIVALRNAQAAPGASVPAQ